MVGGEEIAVDHGTLDVRKCMRAPIAMGRWISVLSGGYPPKKSPRANSRLGNSHQNSGSPAEAARQRCAEPGSFQATILRYGDARYCLRCGEGEIKSAPGKIPDVRATGANSGKPKTCPDRLLPTSQNPYSLASRQGMMARPSPPEFPDVLS